MKICFYGTFGSRKLDICKNMNGPIIIDALEMKLVFECVLLSLDPVVHQNRDHAVLFSSRTLRETHYIVVKYLVGGQVHFALVECCRQQTNVCIGNCTSEVG